MKTLLKLALALGAAVMMAEVERAPQIPTSSGAEPTVFKEMSAADTQIIPNKNGNVVIRVINGGAEATKVSVKVGVTPGGNEVKAKEVEVAAGKTKIIGPLDPKVYNNSKGNLEVTLSKVATVTMEVTQVSF